MRPEALWTAVIGTAAPRLLDWLRELCGLDAGTEGVLVSGGSVSALTALAAARRELGGDTAYLSDQTHASNARALRILGVEHIRVLDSDPAFRLPAAVMREAIAADRAAGRRPFCVVATANHYLLDVLAGIGVAVLALLATAWLPRLFERLRTVGPVIANLL